MSEETPTPAAEKPLPLLSRGLLLEAISRSNARHEDVPVPAWGGAIRISEVGADRRFEIEDAMAGVGEFKDKSLGAKIAHLLRLTAIDEAGASILDETALEAMAKQPPSVLWPIFLAVCRVNRLDTEAAAEHAGKSAAGPHSDSPSD